MHMRHAWIAAFCLTLALAFAVWGAPWVTHTGEEAASETAATVSEPVETTGTVPAEASKPAETAANTPAPAEMAENAATPAEPAQPASESTSDTDDDTAAPAETAKEDGESASKAAACCEPGDQTPPLELVEKIPPGGLHSPYPDYKKMAKDDPDLVKQFRLPGCNECHGGGGGGGFCPALSQGVWFWGNTDDVLFRLISLGSDGLQKQGFTRIQWGTVQAGMPMMGHTIKTADHLWKIIAFIRSINPEGTNPPEKVIPGRMAAPAGQP